MLVLVDVYAEFNKLRDRMRTCEIESPYKLKEAEDLPIVLWDVYRGSLPNDLLGTVEARFRDDAYEMARMKWLDIPHDEALCIRPHTERKN